MTPSPATPSGAPDPDLVTPGTIGFLVTLFIVVIVIFLIRDAMRRVRRVRARSQASDAYPIPLRKYAVPNQSKLSGASEPEATPVSEQTGTGAAAAGSAQAGAEGSAAEAAGPDRGADSGPGGPDGEHGDTDGEHGVPDGEHGGPDGSHGDTEERRSGPRA